MIQFLKSIFSNVWTYVLIIFIFIPTILAVDLVQHYRNNQIVEVLEQVEEQEKTIEVVNAVPDQEFQNISLRDESQGIFGSKDFIDGGITGELVSCDSITISMMVHHLPNYLMSRNTSTKTFQVKDPSG